MAISVKEFFDSQTSTLSYVVYDETTSTAVAIDPVWDFDLSSGALSLGSVQALRDFIRGNGLRLQLIVETHVHADHLSGAQALKSTFPDAQICISERVSEVQKVYKRVYNLSDEFPSDGSQFDRLFKDNEKVDLGGLSFQVLPTPGHTPSCATYLFEGCAFVGDSIFMPDSGTGRCDFPGGSATTVARSIKRQLYALPDDCLLYVGHDYQPNGRAVQSSATVSEHKKRNIHISEGTTEEEFVKVREGRDRTLSQPRLLLAAIQVNINGGRLMPPEGNGRHYLKIPIQL